MLIVELEKASFGFMILIIVVDHVVFYLVWNGQVAELIIRFNYND